MAYIEGKKETLSCTDLSEEHYSFYDEHFGPMGLSSDQVLECQNFREATEKRVRKTPDSPAIIWVDKTCEEEERLTYRQLLNGAKHIAEKMFLKHDLEKGDKVALCFLPGIDFLPAIFACLITGF